MALHLVRAQSAYKHIRIYSFHHTHKHTHTDTCTHPDTPHTHTHTHTHYKCMHYWWWIGKMASQYAEEIFRWNLWNSDTGSCHQVVQTQASVCQVLDLKRILMLASFYLNTFSIRSLKPCTVTAFIKPYTFTLVSVTMTSFQGQSTVKM